MRPRTVGCLPTEDGAIERREVFIPGFMHITDDANCYVLAYSVLKALLPSLNRDDVCAVRRVNHRSRDALGGPSSVPFDVSNDSLFPSLIVRLTSSELVRRIMNARRSFNYLTTADIDRSLLTPDLLATLPNSKILVNEVLSPSEYNNYLSLKEAAKKNGFKYVWHMAGRVLVRRSETERVHVISTVSDLTVILGSPGSELPYVEMAEEHRSTAIPTMAGSSGGPGAAIA